MRRTLLALSLAALLPSAWPAFAGAGPETLFQDDFEAGLAWDEFEEPVDPLCYDTDIGNITVSPDAARSGASGLRVWANQAGTSGNNHVAAIKRVANESLRGLVRFDVWGRINAADADETQTGPEFSLQSTEGALPPVLYLTSIAGFQYGNNPADAFPWNIWAEQAPGRANWTTIRHQALEAGVWYHIVLDADFTRNRYVSLRVTGGQVDRAVDLSNYTIAHEVKWVLSYDAFWISLDATNLWNSCRLGDPTTTRLHYDNLVVTRWPDA